VRFTVRHELVCAGVEVGGTVELDGTGSWLVVLDRAIVVVVGFDVVGEVDRVVELADLEG
jgi:hypothetical protein